jgi:integrase
LGKVQICCFQNYLAHYFRIIWRSVGAPLQHEPDKSPEQDDCKIRYLPRRLSISPFLARARSPFPWPLWTLWARQIPLNAWGHFQIHELHDPGVGRSASTICGYLDYFKNQILPRWGKVCLDDVKAVEVERWLRGLDHANGTKAKIRNHLSALFSHAIRHELYSRLNPISSVRQSAVRERDPDILTIKEMEATIATIGPQAIRVMVMVAATTAIRRSELRGLRWADVDFEGLKLNLRRGLFRKNETSMKTKASRKPVPILPELVEVLLQWRTETPYPADTDWIFASPFTEGKRPYWAESAMTDHIQPAAKAAGITKHIGWHTFRHSLATLLGQNGENVKVVQELLRHASPRITMEVYQQEEQDAKRAALSPFSGIFVVPKAS